MEIWCGVASILCIFFLAGTVYFYVRLLLLRNAVCDAAKQMEEITAQIEENRIVKLSCPGTELERLLEAVNCVLYQIRRKRQSYAKRERALKEQIENVSHDLRTPLTSMIGYLKIMDVQTFREEERDNMQVVLRKAEALEQLITQFYDFSRLTAGDYELKIECVDAARLLRETLADAYPSFAEGKRKVKISLPHGALFVKGDSGAIRRIFENLTENAKKYAKSSFEISFCEEEHTVSFFFRNDTDGLAEGAEKRLFERFYRAEYARSGSSTGLGLTIAKELAEKMGGSLHAESEDKEWLILSCSFRKS